MKPENRKVILNIIIGVCLVFSLIGLFELINMFYLSGVSYNNEIIREYQISAETRTLIIIELVLNIVGTVALTFLFVKNLFSQNKKVNLAVSSVVLLLVVASTIVLFISPSDLSYNVNGYSRSQYMIFLSSMCNLLVPLAVAELIMFVSSLINVIRKNETVEEIKDNGDLKEDGQVN